MSEVTAPTAVLIALVAPPIGFTRAPVMMLLESPVAIDAVALSTADLLAMAFDFLS